MVTARKSCPVYCIRPRCFFRYHHVKLLFVIHSTFLHFCISAETAFAIEFFFYPSLRFLFLFFFKWLPHMFGRSRHPAGWGQSAPDSRCYHESGLESSARAPHKGSNRAVVFQHSPSRKYLKFFNTTGTFCCWVSAPHRRSHRTLNDTDSPSRVWSFHCISKCQQILLTLFIFELKKKKIHLAMSSSDPRPLRLSCRVWPFSLTFSGANTSSVIPTFTANLSSFSTADRKLLGECFAPERRLR